ncbi:unnamed protein product [Didymodactylos carnosus]|uniref:Galactose-1-phosphate uridylyltransferase n=2 Tax=Didymodactylos carnosus TaxID=1234261 RepID=A0A814L7M1_9BILA|nr:unnamed protein product [Didymodactylos carnosus]CAF3829599.1 unnamed protein product [Didymodactylos carnosus]
MPFTMTLPEHSPVWYEQQCFSTHTPLLLENLYAYLSKTQMFSIKACRQLEDKFNSIFRVDEIYGALKLSPVYLKKVKQWLNNDEQLIAQIRNQKILKVYNRYTHEEMIYNSIRGKRPQSTSELSPENYTMKLMKDTMKTCDFCEKNYLSSTAEDSFGRLESKLSYTAANTFKYDRWHTLIVSRNHDTLHLTQDELEDMFELSKKWFKKAHDLEREYMYPEMIWDAMPKAGASQIHTHIQVSLGKDSYYGVIERTRQGAKQYSKDHSHRNYFSDYLQTPLKDLEVMIMGEKLNKHFYRAIHLLFRAFIDDMNEYSFSFGMHLPPMNEAFVSNMPVLCRTVFRNPVTNLRSDMNGLDLYTSSVVGKDRYVLFRKLKSSIENRL